KLDLQKKVITYCEDIQSGQIPSGQKMKWAVNRFFNDLKSIENNESEYYIDWNELLKFNRWAGLFVHSKGVLANKKIELSDFQLWIAANIFCFKKKSNGYRRFREVYIQLGRKNAKSQLLALIVSYVIFLSPESEEAYIASWSKEQSNLIYNEVLGQIRRAKMLKGKFTDSYQTVTVKKNNSTLKALSREARKTGDGTNPSLSVVDEWHAHVTSEIVDVQKSGMVARKSPLLVYITTAGFNLESPCKGTYDYCSEILNPELDTENDEMFAAIYEIDEADNIKDEQVWKKANPIVAYYDEGVASLRSELKLAIDQPERMNNFLTKNMNVWVDAKENGYMDMRKWNKQALNKEDQEAFLQGANIYIGLDLSMTTDLTSVGWVAVKNGKFLVGQHSFVPEDKFRERMSKDKVRYDLFEQMGYLTQTPGNVVDYNYLIEQVIEFANKYGCLMVCYDKWNASHLAQDLENRGLDMVEIPQSIAQLSEPTKKFRENVYTGKVKQTGDPLLRWAVNNAVLKMDQQENIMVGKQVSKDRIDPIAAVLNAFARAMYDDMTVDLNEYILSDKFSF
ncbi:MAG: terminase large subunit, partial [Pisciglobus halotolerans]|nr:terminase large subunit [Pisciglobus halotolerans]